MLGLRGDFRRRSDPDAKEELRSICQGWESGRLKRMDAGNVLNDLIEERVRDRVSLGWPTDHSVVLGTPSKLGINDFDDVIEGFPMFDAFDWFCFIGLACTSLREERPEQDTWILVCDTKEVYAYDRCARRMQLLNRDVSGFLQDGLRNLEAFHETGYVCRYLDYAWYGHVLLDAHVESITECPDARSLAEFVKGHCGLSYRTDALEYFCMGTVEYHRFEEYISVSVLRALRTGGYFVIGLCREFHRIILVDDGGRIYALMSGGYVFKISDSFIAFVRMRLDALKFGGPRSVSPTWEDDYVPVGTQVCFYHRDDYSLPGDNDLLRFWRCQSSAGVRGWPSPDDV